MPERYLDAYINHKLASKYSIGELGSRVAGRDRHSKDFPLAMLKDSLFYSPLARGLPAMRL